MLPEDERIPSKGLGSRTYAVGPRLLFRQLVRENRGESRARIDDLTTVGALGPPTDTAVSSFVLNQEIRRRDLFAAFWTPPENTIGITHDQPSSVNSSFYD